MHLHRRQQRKCAMPWYIVRENPKVFVVILTGAGDKAFCSGGDQNVKSYGGYIDKDGVPHLNILDFQKQIRSLPKPVIAMVNGYAIGGGHVLHVIPSSRLLPIMQDLDKRGRKSRKV